MTTTTEMPRMIDRSEAEATLYRVAICAFTFYPGKAAEEPGYRVDEDVDWCAAPLAGLPAALFAEMRATIAKIIVTPTADRQAFIRRLTELSGADAGLEGA